MASKAILATRSAEARTKGEALIRTADTLLCESWNERMWADGHRIRTFRPLCWRPVDAFLRIASGAFAAAVPQGCTQGARPASSSAMILLVISS